MDALELPRRAELQLAYDRSRLAGNNPFGQVKATRKWPQNGPLRKQNPTGFLASDGRAKTSIRASLYAGVSTPGPACFATATRAFREYAASRDWTIALQVKEVGSGASDREVREKVFHERHRDRPHVRYAVF